MIKQPFFTAFSGGLFGSSSATAGPFKFGQQQTTEALGQNANSLFGTPTISTTGTRIFGQSSSGQTVCVHCFLLFTKLQVIKECSHDLMRAAIEHDRRRQPY